MADQVGVMLDGRIVQWDTPYNLYHEPRDRFVADFIGQGCFLKGTLLAPDTLETEFGIIKGNRAYSWPKGTPVEVLIRPDDIVADAEGNLVAEVIQQAFKGAEILYTLKLASGSPLLSLFPSHADYAIGDQVGIKVEADFVLTRVERGQVGGAVDQSPVEKLHRRPKSACQLASAHDPVAFHPVSGLIEGSIPAVARADGRLA